MAAVSSITTASTPPPSNQKTPTSSAAPSAAGTSTGASVAIANTPISIKTASPHLGTPNTAIKKAQKSTFGVLLTGWLTKTNPTNSFDKPKTRFVVLTHEGLHWFRRESGYDLFGEERGNVSVMDISRVDIYMEGGKGGTPHPDAFEISCKQDVVHRIFRASSPEQAHAWISAIKSAIRARSLYRRETLNGINLLPGHGDGAHEHEAPLVSVVTMKKADPTGQGEEIVLAKGPTYKYGTLIDIPFAGTLPSSSSTSAVVPPSPGGPSDMVKILLSNGDTADVSLRTLTEKAVGDTVNVRVNSLAPIVANIPLTIEASCEAKKSGTSSTSSSSSFSKSLLVVDLLIPIAFAVLLAIWTNKDSTFTKDRVALTSFVTLALLRGLGEFFLHQRKAGTTSSTTSSKTNNMILRISIDDYIIESRSASDEDADPELPPIPKRFIDGCFGDMIEAERRWRITLTWRNEFGTDDILEQEHPYFDLIKDCLPHFYCGVGKDGNPVYYERSGQTDLAKARKAGLPWLVWHYIYATEFVFKVLQPREEAKTITIFDVTGVGLNTIAGEPFEFIRQASHLMQEHYPERCKVICIVNCPSWFSFVWKMIRPLINETTAAKVRIVKAGQDTTDAINEFVELDQIPVEYGGTLRFGEEGETDTCRSLCPEEVKLREHVYAVNKRYQEARAAAGIPEPETFVVPYLR